MCSRAQLPVVQVDVRIGSHYRRRPAMVETTMKQQQGVLGNKLANEI
jgi:hypothetical protein